MMTPQLAFVRSQFPTLESDWIFFDNAGGSQILKPVLDRINQYLLQTNVQHGASYQISQQAMERVQEAARFMAQYINAADPAEIVTGSSTSLLLRILSICISKTFRFEDEIIVTNCDHEANIGPWQDLESVGFTVKKWEINRETLQLHIEDLQKLMTDKTRLVAFTHSSNVIGTMNPIKEITKIVHERGALVCVDGVAYAPHRLIDVQELDVDFYLFSYYKVYGPHYAQLYGKKEHLLKMPGINHFFIGQTEIPYKFQPGSVNYELCSSMLGLQDYIKTFCETFSKKDLSKDPKAQKNFVFHWIARHEEKLASRLLKFLNSRKNVRIIGHDKPDRKIRVPTISFVVDGKRSDEITQKVDPHKIGIRFGHFYAKRLIDDLGLEPQNGVVRVSMVHYNTEEEVDRLIGVLDKII